MYEFLNNIDFSNDVISLPENARTKAQAQKLIKKILQRYKIIRTNEEADYADIELSRNEVRGEDDNGDKYTVDGSIDMFISIYQNSFCELKASVEISQLAFGSNKLEGKTFSYPSKEFDKFVCEMVDRYFKPLPKEQQ